MLVLIFKSEHFFVELIKKQTRILHNGSVISGLEGQ